MTSYDDAPTLLPLDRPFTTQDAREAGVKDKLLYALTQTGYLRRLVAGVYVADAVPDSIELRCDALALVVPGDCVMTDRTAAWLHGAPNAMAPNEHLAVPPVSCFRPSDHGRLRNELTVSGEREMLERDLMVVHGIVVTTPLRTALDLGRLQPTDDLRLAGMDAMLALGVDHQELLSEIERFKRRRGVVGLRGLAPQADGGSQSFGESASRRRWNAAGLPRPTTQIPVIVDGVVVFILDFGLEDLLLAAEYDGEQWHSSPGQVAHDTERRAWLSSERGWMVEVLRRNNVFGHHQDAEQRLRAAYDIARASLGARRYFV
ncbi:hypothetical protein NSZ01_08740 [Nocardioides szechwanensis]|uniref:Transcriptional regulator, AbiEi antitoxin, Type IV TA system n=1 Tax=Nocardioides szechwanensis TaxID=1005944 RepID=A0A1G9UXL3_9ACTN|nr:hypothetical protein [Nocardioides szechwanensis]GEP33106.1 hypothetical protein NSZ01_08740 [Nocardioides szechwanensis]SDM64714.1 hypothetical protein SAMN05192576_0585 [Nocardioides szechwanensis]